MADRSTNPDRSALERAAKQRTGLYATNPQGSKELRTELDKLKEQLEIADGLLRELLDWAKFMIAQFDNGHGAPTHHDLVSLRAIVAKVYGEGE